jgi:hypothetical protein
MRIMNEVSCTSGLSGWGYGIVRLGIRATESGRVLAHWVRAAHRSENGEF